jgi:hypothetical protein
MATENRWRARKIQAELSKLGIRVILATVSRYLPKTKPNPTQLQRWMTFLRNPTDAIAGMDFFVVPTVRFRLLYVWFAIDHGRRRGLHFNVTENPTARWVTHQLRETFPDKPPHRFLIYDNDAIFSAAVTGAIKSFEICPKRKYADRFAEGSNLVVLEPDVAAELKTPRAVNKALRDYLESKKRRKSGAA